MKIYQSKTKKEGRQTMNTPLEIPEFCAQVWGCNVDLAASAKNKKFYYYFSDVIPTGLSEGYIGNALTDEWRQAGDYSSVGFCNPPYANLTPWLNKAAQEARNGFTSVFLLPSFNGDEWAARVWDYGREIVLIEGRINFIVEETGKPLSGNGRGSMLVVFGPGLHVGRPSFRYVHRNRFHRSRLIAK